MVGERSAGSGGSAACTSLVRVVQPAISLARLPPLVPGRGLAWSAALHVTTIATLALTPLFFPVDLPLIAPLRGDFVELARSESIFLPYIPHTSDAGSQAAGASKSSGGSSQTQRMLPSHALPARVEVSSLAAPPFSGAQEIVSDLPDATNSVQTIRRPDLPSPPKLKFPQLLQSIVAGPPAEAPPIVPQPIAAPTEVIAIEEKIIVKPSLIIPTAQRRVKETSPRAPKVNIANTASPPALLDVHPRAMPALRMEVQTIASKTAVIINAITVPSDTPVKIPDAELSGSFTVKTASAGPSKETTAAQGRGSGDKSAAVGTVSAGDARSNANGGANPSAGAGTGKATASDGAGAATARGMGAGTGVGTGTGPASGSGIASSGIRTGNEPASGAGSGGGTRPGTGSGRGSGVGSSPAGNGLPGISIVGGSGGRSGRSIPSAQRSSRPGYDITIISGGSNGGASRDTGVFSRSETVYSVYIRMNDTGGGADWSMQYAIVGPTQAGTGMLTPPVAVKKVAASIERDPAQNYENRIFITGTISETGEVTGLRAIRPMDERTKSAMSALQQWQFLPAQLDGQAVSAKVLIGVVLSFR